jgi:hypothetical protein
MNQSEVPTVITAIDATSPNVGMVLNFLEGGKDFRSPRKLELSKLGEPVIESVGIGGASIRSLERIASVFIYLRTKFP